MGTLSNFTILKRQEMLDKSSISEPLNDKLFGRPLGKRQEEVIKTPQTVKVDVPISNGQRKVTTSRLLEIPHLPQVKRPKW